MEANLYDEGRVADEAPPAKAGKAIAQKGKARPKAASAKWAVSGLIVLSAVPLIFGVLRLIELAGGAEITPTNARFFASPVPVVLHIVSAILYAILGAFQFSPALRRRRPRWHRVAGRVLVVCGLVVGLSGLWMTHFYPRPIGSVDLLYLFRLFFGTAMVVAVVLGYTTIRKGDVKRHRAWMMRAYAIGLGAGTQVFTLGIGQVIAAPLDELGVALMMGAAWVINLAVAEWIIRRRPTPPARSAVAVALAMCRD